MCIYLLLLDLEAFTSLTKTAAPPLNVILTFWKMWIVQENLAFLMYLHKD